jgi:hypothetical protein
MDYDSQKIVTRDGTDYQVMIVRDDDCDPPWEREDGHGPVTAWTTREPDRGEVVLARGRSHVRYYNLLEARRIALRDGWDSKPYGEPANPRHRATKAARSDYELLRRWCDDQWWYVGVVVTRRCTCCGGFTGPSASLWGIESDAGDYLDEVAGELIDEIEGEAA